MTPGLPPARGGKAIIELHAQPIVIALATRMRDVNTELTKRLTDLRRKRPPSQTLARLERQLVLAFAAQMVGWSQLGRIQ